MAVQLLTIAEYARHRGCSEKAVRKALDEGRITRAAPGRRCIDPVVADIQWAKNTRARADSARSVPAQGSDGFQPAAAAPGGSAPATALAQPDYHADRNRRERIEADRAELALWKEQRLVIDRQRGELGAMTVYRELRDACQASHKNTAPRLLGQTDVREVLLLLEEGYRQAWQQAERRIAELTEGWRQHGA